MGKQQADLIRYPNRSFDCREYRTDNLVGLVHIQDSWWISTVDSHSIHLPARKGGG